nr:hypothetical protein [Tanacetum cinerariifolium]
MSAAKLPILNPNEFNLWKMRIEQYFLMTDYSLWERLARKNELKAHGTLLMALPDKHQLKLNTHKDANTLMEAIEKGFRGNIKTKKRNKTDLEEQSLDDLFNSLKIYEAEVKSSSSISNSTQNIAFVSSSNTDSTNELVSAPASVSAVSTKIPVFSLPNVDTLMRARRFLQWTGRNLGANGPTSMGFDMSKVECYNCHTKGHFARKCRSPKDTRKNAMTEVFKQKRNLPTMLLWPSLLQVLLLIMRYQSGNGYHVVPLPYTGTLMPPKPDLVFHNAPNAVETVHTAFNVELSPTKPDNDLSHTHRPSAPIIEDWHVETSIPTANPKTAIPKPTSNDKHKNRKACFVCKSLDHLIKDCDYHEKKLAQTTASNHATRGHHKHYASMPLLNPQRHVVSTAVVPKSKLVPINAAGPNTVAVSKINVTRPRQDKPIITKPNSPPRWHINRSPTPKSSNFPPKVTDVKVPQVNAAKGVQGKWEWKPKCPILDHGNPEHAVKDKGVIDSGCSRHMTGNMSYLSDFEELNGRHVAFGGNPKGEKVGEGIVQQYVLFLVWSSGSTSPHNTDGDVAFDKKELEFEGRKPESEVNVSPSKFEDFSDNSINKDNAAGTLVPAVGKLSSNSTNTFSAAGPLNAAASPTHGKSSYVDSFQLPDDLNLPELEDITYSDDEDDVGAKADFNNLETSITVSPISKTRVHKDHLMTQIIGNLSSATQTRKEPKRVYQALKDPSWIKAMQEEFLQFKMQKVWVLVDLPHGKRAIDGKSASTHIDTKKPLLKDLDGEDIDVYTYISMIGSLMYLTSSRPNIMFTVCACAHFQVTPKASLLHVVKRIFRYLKGKPHLRFWCRVFTAELARMGYEKPSTKLTFYKAFFSSQWKFLIHTILQCMSAERTSWNDFSSSMASAVICLSTGVVSAADDVVPATVNEPSIPSPLLPTSPPQPSQDQPSTSQDKIAQALEITKLKHRVKKLERRNKASKLKRMIADMDADVDVTLKDVAAVAKDVQDAEIKESLDVLSMQDDEGEPAELQEVVKVVTTAKLITEVVTAASAIITAAAPQLTTAPTKSKDKGKGITVKDPKPLKKQAQIEQDEAYARELEAELNKNIDWDETKEKMDEEDSRALKRLSESQEDKASKKQKLDEEVEKLKKHLMIVPNDDDDVYSEATPLALKVLVVDYEIYTENNKPYYKIKRADGSHQLYLSFLSMLRNFDREDLEVLWRLVKE